jgi:Ca-activated chloride channel family protein
MSDSIFKGTPARTKLAHDQDNQLFALFSFYPPAMDNDEERASLDIAVALDRSGSMGSDKMEGAKQSLLKLVDHLKQDDTLSVTTFDSQIDVAFEQTKMTAANKNLARQAIRDIHARGATNLSGGLFKALDFLKSQEKKDGRIRKCLVFTDGQANNGISNPKQLAEAALEYRAGIGISSFGYGNDHHSVLLDEISQDGSFYFIDTPDKILVAFGTELGGLVSTWGQNVELRLKAGDGVKIDEVLNDLTVDVEGASGKPGFSGDDIVRVTCDDLLASMEYHVAVKLALEKRDKVFPRDTSLVTATAKFVNCVTKKQEELTFTLKARFVKPDEADEKDDEKVMAEVALQKTASSIAEASRLADAGNFKGAQDVMQAQVFFCSAIGDADMANAGQALSANYANQGVYTANSSRLKGGGRMMRKRAGGASGQSMMREIDPSVLKARLGNSERQERMVESFTEGSTSDSSPDAVQLSQTAAPITPDPMAPQLGSVPNVRVPAEPPKKEVSKKRSTRW